MNETTHTIDTRTGLAAPARVSADRTQAIFTEIAGNYERFNHVSSFGRDRAWLARLVEAAGITTASRVLDVAGGTGEVTFAICRMRRPAHVLLTDYTPAMLNVARTRIAAGEGRGVPIDVQVEDAQALSLPSQSFDVVTMAYGIRNMPDRPAALAEIARVLVPGGRLAVLEFSTPPWPPARMACRAYERWGIPVLGSLLAGKRDDFAYLSESIRAFPGPDEFASMLRQAGFSHVRYELLTFGAVAIHVAVK